MLGWRWRVGETGSVEGAVVVFVVHLDYYPFIPTRHSTIIRTFTPSPSIISSLTYFLPV